MQGRKFPRQCRIQTCISRHQAAVEGRDGERVVEPGGRTHSHVEPTRVTFRGLAVDEIEQYVALDQPLDCAGGIRSEGLGFHLIEQVESKDPSALIGLPLIALSKILRTIGINPLSN